MIGLRRRSRCLREAPVEILHTSDVDRTLVFHRALDDEEFLVVASLRNHAHQGPDHVQSEAIADGSWKVVATNLTAESWGETVVPPGAVLKSQGGRLTSVVPVAGVVVLERVEGV